jgi:hypothetical protein
MRMWHVKTNYYSHRSGCSSRTEEYPKKAEKNSSADLQKLLLVVIAHVINIYKSSFLSLWTVIKSTYERKDKSALTSE